MREGKRHAKSLVRRYIGGGHGADESPRDDRGVALCFAKNAHAHACFAQMPMCDEDGGFVVGVGRAEERSRGV